MSIKIPNPQTKSFKQIGNSDVLGNIWSSFNLDLTENLGRIRVAPRGLLVEGSSTEANLGTPVSFKYYNNGVASRIWILAGARLFYNTGNPDDTLTQDATASTPTTLDYRCDMETFNGALYVTGNGSLYKYTGSWTTNGTGVNVGPTSMCVFGGRLYFSQGGNSSSFTSQILSLSSADVVTKPTSAPNTNQYTLDLAGFDGGTTGNINITCIRSSSDRVWIATINTVDQSPNSGLKGYVFEWDGVSTNPTRLYKLDTMGAMAMVIKDDIPYIMDADGKLLKYAGSSFEEVARLPILPSRYLIAPATLIATQRFIHPNGMTVKNGKIQILINNRNVDGTTFNENLPSGVWEYDENIGLYHKYSTSISPVGFGTRTDYAQNVLSEVGALYYSKSGASSDNDGDLMWGAKYYTDATTQAFGVFTNNSKDTLSKVGYLVSTKIESQNVQDAWQKAYAKFKRLLNSTDRIALKYRTFETTPINATITWTSTTTFTSTTDLSTVAVGDEVEVTRGTGGGQIEHITAIVNNAGTYTVTLENAVIGASGTATARIQKWIKIRDTSDQTIDYTECPIGVKSNWIQLKLVMYFTGKGEVNEIELINSTFKPSV